MKLDVCTIILFTAFAGFFFFFILYISLTIQIRLADFHYFFLNTRTTDSQHETISTTTRENDWSLKNT